MPKISVVIPAYNSAKTIGRAIGAVLSQKIDQEFELIVVDDGSRDDTAKIVQSYPQVRYVHQENAGPAAARNRGAQEATGEIVFFTDSDCVPHPDWLAKLTPRFVAPEVAVTAGSYGIANPENLLARCIHAEVLFRHRYLMPEFPKVFGSYNFGVRKMVFQNVGGFDTGYRFASGEDNDLSYKILSAGHRIRFERAALVDHVHPSRLTNYLFEQYRHGYWRAKMYRVHPSMMAGDDYTFWKDIVEIPAVYGSIILLAGGGLGWVICGKLAAFLLTGLVGIEAFYGCLMTRNLPAGIFYSAVMFLRAWVRALGFLAGGVRFLVIKKCAKI